MSLNQGVKEFSGGNSVRDVASDFLRSTTLTGVFKHSLKFLFAHVLVIPDLIQVGSDVDVGSEEQNVVN